MAAKIEAIETADSTAKPKRKTVAGTVTPEMFERIEDYRWANRLSVSEVVSAALEEYFKAR